MTYFTLVYFLLFCFCFVYGQVFGTVSYLKNNERISKVKQSQKYATFMFYILGAFAALFVGMQLQIFLDVPTLIEYRIPLHLDDNSWIVCAVIWSSSLIWGLTRNLNNHIWKRIEEAVILIAKDIKV